MLAPQPVAAPRRTGWLRAGGRSGRVRGRGRGAGCCLRRGPQRQQRPKRLRLAVDSGNGGGPVAPRPTSSRPVQSLRDRRRWPRDPRRRAGLDASPPCVPTARIRRRLCAGRSVGGMPSQQVETLAPAVPVRRPAVSPGSAERPAVVPHSAVWRWLPIRGSRWLRWLPAACGNLPCSMRAAGWRASTRPPRTTATTRARWWSAPAGCDVTSSRVSHFCDRRPDLRATRGARRPPAAHLRHNDQVHTLWPQSKVAVLEKRDPVAACRRPSQAVEPNCAGTVRTAERRPDERMAGHDSPGAPAAAARPELRYAQRLWADKAPG